MALRHLNGRFFVLRFLCRQLFLELQTLCCKPVVKISYRHGGLRLLLVGPFVGFLRVCKGLREVPRDVSELLFDLALGLLLLCHDNLHLTKLGAEPLLELGLLRLHLLPGCLQLLVSGKVVLAFDLQLKIGRVVPIFERYPALVFQGQLPLEVRNTLLLHIRL